MYPYEVVFCCIITSLNHVPIPLLFFLFGFFFCCFLLVLFCWLFFLLFLSHLALGSQRGRDGILLVDFLRFLGGGGGQRGGSGADLVLLVHFENLLLQLLGTNLQLCADAVTLYYIMMLENF